MKVYPITKSLPGEQVIGVDPILAPEVDAAWRRRLNLYPGRALQADALTAEQDARAGRLATEGQALSPGVVTGLEVGVENDPTDGVFLRIHAGTGLMYDGEDVVVPLDLRLALKDLRVFWPLSDSVTGSQDDEDEEGEGEEDETGAPPVDPSKEPTERFEDWVSGEDLPHAGILVLQPIELQLLQVGHGHDDPADDPCEEDPTAFAFENWERRDACRPVLYPWPTHWKPLPPRDTRWRNQLAYTVFREEGRKGPDADFPWEAVGVPIALIAFDDEWKPLFVDRNSVARAGGKPKRRTSLVPGAGNPFLWQARFDQLLEELTDANAQNVPIADVVARFRYIPPAGLLPRSACAPETAQQSFFPSGYVIDAAPVPIEHLDVALEASASLGRYDLFTPDQVRLLIPVPQKVWEPRLLHGEDVDPAFQQAIDEAIARRADWLMRRESVRQKAAVVIQTLIGLAPAYAPPEDDPGRLEPEPEIAIFPIPISGSAHQSGSGPGVHQHLFADASSDRPLPDTARFVVWVFLDPNDLPRQMQVTWYGTVGEQAKTVAVSWGESLLLPTLFIPVFNAGPLPPAGRWVRLEVDAHTAQLTNLKLTGMQFTAVHGRVTWARAGHSRITNPSPAHESVWVDGLPEGATEIVDEDNEPWIWITATPPEVDAEPAFGTVRAGTPPIRVADPVERLVDDVRHSSIRPGEVGVIHSLGLLRFIEILQAAVDQANDQINFGYLRVQTAMYRLRQAILGDKVADRLVTSPVLAAIARESTGAAQVTKSLTDVFKSMQASKVKAEQRWWGRETEFAAASIMAAHAGVPNGGDVPNGGSVPNGMKMDTTAGTTAKTGTFANVVIAADKPAGANVFNLLTTSGFEAGREIKQLATTGAAAALRERILRAGDGSKVPPIGAGGKVPPPTSDVEEAHPTDKTIRTTSIAERILDSRAAEAKDFCAATKRDVIKGLLGLAMNIEDLPVPGLALHDSANQDKSPERTGDPPSIPETEIGPAEAAPTAFKYRGVDTPPLGRQILFGTGMPARESQARQLMAFRGSETGGFNPTLFNWITNEVDPLDPSDNEANHFAIGSDLLNHTIALLRSAEARVAEYRAVIARAQQTVDELTVAALESDRRLKEIEDELTEARHDVATARALLLDEEQRVRAINERRAAILREHVTFIAYHRPRLTDPLVDAPVRVLDPGPTASPVPECLSHDEPVPAEIHEYLALVREAPANWFVHVPRLFDYFDRLNVLQNLMFFTKGRSQFSMMAQPQIADAAPSTMLGKAMGSVRQAQFAVISAVRQQRQSMDLSPLAGESWSTLRTLAPTLVGLGDLMDASHGRGDVAHLATQELDQIGRVAGCLYGHFSKTLPVLRLAWAEEFSQYDATASLRSLAVLPRWGEINVLERREMQALVDWLFLRINARVAEAASLINDLIRTCLLLASHSPVNQILSGHVQADTPIQPGGQVKVTIPTAGVRVGMHVLLYKGADVVARGVVEDLSAGTAAARIIHATKNETLAQGARVQFTPAPAAPTPKVVMAAMAARREV
jgi:hypothetical protein